MKRTKIVATIGPACHDIETLKQMMQAGMNVARLNFSHGTHEDHATLVANIRAAAKELAMPIAIMQDVQGPKIRLGTLPEEGVVLDAGAIVQIDTSIDDYADERLPLTLHTLHEYVKAGERILIADGTIELHVQSVEGTIITTDVTVPGTVYSHKGVNIPDTNLTLSALTEKDKADLAFGVAQQVDLVAVSFVRSAEDILDAKATIAAAETATGVTPEVPIRIIAKIERPEAVSGIDAILEVVDGIMVARGDLGVEVHAADVPIIQKDLIAKARESAKPVIVATQMLDSMQHNPRPTRAEVSDVANAVIDHTDAVMLSNETATGDYPVETVAMMAEIITEIENSKYDDIVITPKNELTRLFRKKSDIAALASATTAGVVGETIAQFRPELPIIIATTNDRRMRQLNLCWGIVPMLAERGERGVDHAIEAALEQEIITTGQHVLVHGEHGSAVRKV